MSSRRNLCKGALALGSAVLVDSGFDPTVNAARRGYGGPPTASNSGSGLRFEINVGQNDVLTVVRISGNEPSPYSVTLVNRTPFELKVDIFHLKELMYSARIEANASELIELKQSGTYQFTVARGDGPVLFIWEASVPSPA